MSNERILIRWDDDLISEGWTAAPNALIRDHTLSMEARWLWIYLRSHSANFMARQETIAKAAGCGRDKLRKIIKELVTAGYMSHGQDKDPETKRYGVSWYWLHKGRSEPEAENPVTENQSPELTSGNDVDPQVEAGDVFTGDGSTGDGSTGDGESTPLKKNKLKKTNQKKTNEEGPAADAAAPPRTREARGTRIPEDFTVTPQMIEWFNQSCPNLRGRGRAETAKFRDHWKAESGVRAVKRDWVAAWRVWMRKAEGYAQPRSSGRNRTFVDSKTGAMMDR